jgi:hypothetical protein
MVTGRAKRSGVAGLRRDPTCGGTGHTGTRPRSYFPGRCRRLRPWWLSAQAPRSGRLWVSWRGGCRGTDRGSGGGFGFDSLGFTPRPLICRGVPSQRQRPLLLPNDSAAQEVVGVSISIAMCGCPSNIAAGVADGCCVVRQYFFAAESASGPELLRLVLRHDGWQRAIGCLNWLFAQRIDFCRL